MTVTAAAHAVIAAKRMAPGKHDWHNVSLQQKLAETQEVFKDHLEDHAANAEAIGDEVIAHVQVDAVAEAIAHDQVSRDEAFEEWIRCNGRWNSDIAKEKHELELQLQKLQVELEKKTDECLEVSLQFREFKNGTTRIEREFSDVTFEFRQKHEAEIAAAVAKNSATHEIEKHELRSSRNTLKLTVDALETEKSHLHASLEEERLRVKSSEAERLQLSEKLDLLQERFEQNEQKTSKLTVEVEAKTSRIAELQVSFEEQQRQWSETFESLRSAHSSEVAAFKAQISAFEQEISRLQMGKETLFQHVESGISADLRARIEAVRSENSNLTAEICTLKATLEDAKSQCNYYLSQEKPQLSNTIAELQSSVARSAAQATVALRDKQQSHLALLTIVGNIHEQMSAGFARAGDADVHRPKVAVEGHVAARVSLGGSEPDCEPASR